MSYVFLTWDTGPKGPSLISLPLNLKFQGLDKATHRPKKVGDLRNNKSELLGAHVLNHDFITNKPTLGDGWRPLQQSILNHA